MNPARRGVGAGAGLLKSTTKLPLIRDILRGRALTAPLVAATILLCAGRCVSAGEHPRLRDALAEALKHAEAIGEPKTRSDALAGVAIKWARVDPVRATGIAEGIEDPGYHGLAM